MCEFCEALKGPLVDYLAQRFASLPSDYQAQMSEQFPVCHRSRTIARCILVSDDTLWALLRVGLMERMRALCGERGVYTND